ncbi:hypothetical protein [Paraburkholderia terrae]|uniref:Uncharacterized protein n=1 Tax=Paraburkholderia terrae TaxID=311230 RepID=A0A2I8ETQ3_9BURK|nr:hypothetical protein [Paraburkholderia terrae]AUT62870.1 hypothetical protein C2L65_25180 [Paraburkholderia terrae]
MPDERESTAIPAVIATGTPKEVDAFLLACLSHEELPQPSLAAMYEWIACLTGRKDDDFHSHISTCHYWLYFQYAKQAGLSPDGQAYPPRPEKSS